MKLEPIGDRFLVEPIEDEKTTDSGILLVKTTDKPSRGRVVAVGTGMTTAYGVSVYPLVEVRDVVHYTRWGGATLEHEGRKLLVMRNDDVLAVEVDDAE